MALGISTPEESAGDFRDFGSLSPAAGRGTGSTGTSGGTWHFHPQGKCRTFQRKRFTFPRGRQGYRLHRHLWRHPPFPPPGKVPGFSAKMVHFSPRPAGVPAPQPSLAALTIPSPRESAGFFRENGSLSPAACRGIGSTGLSGGTHHSLPRGKCRTFRRKRFTFPPVMRLLRRSSRACLGKCLVYRHSGKGTLLDLGSNGGFVAKSGQSSKFSEYIYLIISAMHLNYELNIVKVLDSAFLGRRYDSPLLKTLSFHARIGGGRHRTYAHRSLLPTVLPGVRSSLMIVCKLHVNGAAIAP